MRAVRFDAGALREAYAAAGAHLLDLAGALDLGTLGEPALGTWSLRDLLGHAGRSWETVTEYAAAGVGRAIEVEHPFDYARALALVHIDPGAVDARARAAGDALGDDVLGGLRSRRAAAEAVVATYADDAPMATLAGVMRLGDYLPCRVFELVVHGEDVKRARGLDLPAPDVGVAVALAFAAGLAGESIGAVPALLALAGRGPLPAGFSVL